MRSSFEIEACQWLFFHFFILFHRRLSSIISDSLFWVSRIMIYRTLNFLSKVRHLSGAYHFNHGIYTQGTILFNYVKEWNNAICSNMGRSRDDDAKGSKKEKGKFDVTSMRNEKIWHKWTIHKRETGAQSKNFWWSLKKTWGEGYMRSLALRDTLLACIYMHV